MNSSKIIVVEDEVLVADELKSRIEDFGHSVLHVFSSGEKAIEAINRSNKRIQTRLSINGYNAKRQD
jgi:CheY-like chemotaxis protein